MTKNEPFEVSGGRTFPFSQPGDWVALAAISAGAKATYLILCGHVQFIEGPVDDFWPTLTTIGELISRPNGKPTTPETVSSWVNELENLGAINVTETRTNNGRRKHYMVHQMPPDGYEGPRSYAEFYRARRKKRGGPDLEKTGGPDAGKTAGQSDLEKTGGPDLEKTGGPDLEKTGGKEHQGNKTKKKNTNTHTALRVTHSPNGAEAERVCVSDEAKRVFADVLTTAVPPEVRGRISQRQTVELSQLVEACLTRGHSATAIARRTTGICNTQTLYPAKIIRNALSELESESPASHAPQAPSAPSVPSQATQAPRCRRSDCLDGRQMCSAECGGSCSGYHASPRGGPCPECNPNAKRTRKLNLEDMIKAAAG